MDIILCSFGSRQATICDIYVTGMFLSGRDDSLNNRNFPSGYVAVFRTTDFLSVIKMELTCLG